jgi:broad specificity phosphatase PhoE
LPSEWFTVTAIGYSAVVTVTEMLLVRHGESQGNVAREAAESDGAEVIAIGRDPDVALSDLGEQQASAVGRWLRGLPQSSRPAAVWSSPYLRAAQTAEIALGEAGLTERVHRDERLRDRELGVLDRLTSAGVRARFPAEAERRRSLGKFYYRPPGGESWVDVALRLRSLLGDLERANLDGSVLIVSHDAVIMLIRYLLEELDERELLDIAAGQPIGNGSVSRFVRDDAAAPWRLFEFGVEEHILLHGVQPTTHGGERPVRPR